MALRYPGGFISNTAPTVNANTAKGVWTLEEAMQYIKAGQWPVATGGGDPYFGYNTILLPGQGTNLANNNTFQDSSTNNFTVFRNGNTTQGTFTPFSHSAGYWGNYFNGGTYLNVANNTVLNLTGVSFTIEAWIYCTALSGTYASWIAGKRAIPGPYTFSWYFALNSSGQVIFADNSTNANSGVSVPLNQWVHVAAVGTGSSVQMYVNGVKSGAAVTLSISEVSTDLTIGNYTVDNPVFNGYISNLRLIKGQALTTGSFTPPTGPVSSSAVGWTGANVAGSITGTVSLVTCQSNRFVDNSGNNLTITAGGTPSVQTFQPFGTPTSAYSASTNGGSGYFDGSGDYVNTAYNSNLLLNGVDSTIEGWFYLATAPGTAASATAVPFIYQGNGYSGSPDLNWAIFADNINVYFLGAGATYISASVSVIPVRSWFHLAICVTSGTSATLYVNGISQATGSITAIGSSTSYSTGIGGGYQAGASPIAQYMNGYASNIRITKGAKLYTTNFTPPTALLTTTVSSGTVQLLLNFTNAGVIDNAVSNDLETVGGASISTTQYKWGTSSIYFNPGETNPLVVPNNPMFNLSSGDFTIESWVYISSNRTYNYIISKGTSSAREWAFSVGPSDLRFYWSTNGSSTGDSAVTASVTISTGTWVHAAVTRVGTTIKLFLNGNQVGSGTFTSMYSGTASVYVGRFMDFTSISHDLSGYLSDLRITKGYARYLYNFTAPTAAFPLFYQAAATPSTDPYFENTTLLLPGNGTNGAQNNTFLDSSTNAFTITRNGNTTQGTFTPFAKDAGRWGNYFNGGGSGYLNAVSNTAFAFGTGDFTLEAFIYATSYPSAGTVAANIISAHNWNGSGFDFTFRMGQTGLLYFEATGGSNVTSSVSVQTNTWNHVACVRSGSTVTFWLNGISVGGGTISTNIPSTTAVSVGAALSGGTYGNFTGYISNARVTKGGALYTSAFTPSTTPLTTTVSAGTVSLLTCQSNRFVDNSANAFALTAGSGSSVQAFSPFPTTAAYSAGTNGGSGYFDGSGDNLTAASNAAFALGTGDFTVETFAYYSSLTNVDASAVINWDGITWGSNKWSLHLDHSTARAKVTFWVHNINSGAPVLTSTTTTTVGQWYHVAVSRSGNTFRLFINGVLEASATSSISLDNNVNSPIYVGGGGGGGGTQYFNGYLASTRLVKGTAVYTATFTPPTAPLTAITNTSLLCNYTNGGIIDNTMSNDLETVGNTSISTTQSKWGGSSMYFDGSGDYLIMPNVLTGQFGTGDFTIEYWDYHGTQGTNYAPQVGTFSSATPAGTWRLGTFSNNGGLYFAYHNGSTYVDVQFGSTLYNDSTWRHFAISRYNGTLIAFVNGLQVGTPTACTQNFNSSNRVILGAELGTPTYFTGYLQDVRVTKGVARYTQNFTAPTSAFLTL